jgi:protein TonB
MLRRFSLIALGLGVAGLLCMAACAHRSGLNAPPDPRLFAPSDPPQGQFGSVAPATEHLKPMAAAPKTAPEQETLKAMAPPPAPEQPTPAPAPPPAKTPATRVDSSASTGEHIVDELPEAITKVAPELPEQARAAGVAGVVMVAAHVREDGAVDSTRVVRPIPLLDDAARACVQQWRFKPALRKGTPIAVWVTVPVRFMFPTSPN